jgi:hypothetical protein
LKEIILEVRRGAADGGKNIKKGIPKRNEIRVREGAKILRNGKIPRTGKDQTTQGDPKFNQSQTELRFEHISKVLGVKGDLHGLRGIRAKRNFPGAIGILKLIDQDMADEFTIN